MRRASGIPLDVRSRNRSGRSDACNRRELPDVVRDPTRPFGADDSGPCLTHMTTNDEEPTVAALAASQQRGARHARDTPR